MLLPVFSPTQQVNILGSYINNDDADFPDWDFTGLSFSAGDLLVALISDEGNDPISGPSGFAKFGESKTDDDIGRPVIGVYTKTAIGTETTFSNANQNSTVATITIRGGEIGSIAFANNTEDPPAATNASGDTVFAILGRRTGSVGIDESVTPPSGFVMLVQAGNSTDGGTIETALHITYKSRADINENPGAFTDITGGATETVATFNLTPG